MIATTIMSSIRVKPRLACIDRDPYGVQQNVKQNACH